MPTYKTPGVYLEEISMFPPSVAAVETAIPCFIGYTEKAEERSPEDLHLTAKRIGSLLEYQVFYGGAPPLNIDLVRLASDGSIAETTVQPKYNLFHGLQLFYGNGGGDCYIISVGSYEDDIELGDRGDPVANPGLDAGLAALERFDEPTIIVIPDAVQLANADDMYTLQKNALAQCNALKDRFAVLDLREEGPAGASAEKKWSDGVEAFRNKIGTQYLKYGAAYTPHLTTSLPKSVSYRAFRNNPINTDRFRKAGAKIDLDALPGAKDLENPANPAEVQAAIPNLREAANDLDLIENEFGGTEGTIANPANEDTLLLRANAIGVPAGSRGSVASVIEFLHNKTLGSGTIGDLRTYLDFLYEMVVFADGWIWDTTTANISGDPPFPGHPTAGYQTAVQGTEVGPFRDAVTSLVAWDKKADSELNGDTSRFLVVEPRLVDDANYPDVDFANAAGDPPASADPFDGADNGFKIRDALPALRIIADTLLSSVRSLVDVAKERYKQREEVLNDNLPSYPNLVRSLASAVSVLSPSPAIAGIYAQVDADRGVWKAPANVSVNMVSDLTVHFTESQTDGLNVDEFGKSINAIKFFTGRGTLVWGARTLAGNDNEWRYIQVRRFFNFVEESVKKSTMWAVFEPNDASTWLKVKGMIEAFLTLQWRDGALQGAKPDDAFFVKVGLGETMNTQDVLEGRMIVEIGMAVVRPAEFIILRFMHKLVETG